MKHCKPSTALPKSSLEIADGFSTPNPDELGPATRVCQEHLASEKHLELIPPNMAFNEASLAINMTPLAPL
jgi:hypothetical protein